MSLNPFAPFAVGCLRTRRWDRFSRTAQTVEMEFNGVVHFAFDAVSRLARGDAAGKIGRIGGIAGRSFFNDDQVPAHFNHRIFFNSLSTTLNSGSPVTNSASLIFANAAAKQSAYDIFLVALKTAACRTSSKSRASTGTISICIPAIS